MKRLFAAAITVVMLVLTVFSFVGCGGKTSNAPAPFEVTGGYDGSAVTITFSHTMGANLRAVLDNYIP